MVDYLTHAQIRAARSMTGETREVLAKRAGVTVPVLKRLESPERKLPDPLMLKAVKAAFEEKGLQFLAATEDVGDGVKYITAVGNKWTDMLPHARALLGHSVQSFAKETGLSADSISRVEKEEFKRFPEDSVRKIRETLSTQGVIIILEDGESGAGVRFRRP